MSVMGSELTQRLCPLCGKEVSRTFGGLCKDCYGRLHPLLEVPDSFEATVCKVCGSYRVGDKWTQPRSEDPLLEAAEAAVRRAVRARGNVEEIRVVQAEGILTIAAKGSAIEGMEPYLEEYKGSFRVRWGLCNNCINRKSKREVARVQVRARNRQLTSNEAAAVKRIVERALSRTQRRALDLIEVVELPQGIDLTFSSLESARRVVSELRKSLLATILETRKVAGTDSRGRRAAKLTVRMLLPEFRPGDIIEYGEQLYYVFEVQERGVRVVELRSMSEQRIEGGKALVERSRVVCRREELGQAVVASISPGFAEVVSGEECVQVPLSPRGLPAWAREGERVLVARIDGKYYLLPLGRV